MFNYVCMFFFSYMPGVVIALMMTILWKCSLKLQQKLWEALIIPWFFNSVAEYLTNQPTNLITRASSLRPRGHEEVSCEQEQRNR